MKQRNRFFKALVLGLACCSLLVVFSVSAFAADDAYPSKPVRFIIPWPPGGGVDSVGRLMVPGLSERLGRQVIVENRGGSAGLIGLEAAAKSAPDGYTITILNDSYAFPPAFGEKMPFDPLKAFAPIGQIARGDNVLVTHPDVQAKTVQEFIALLKQKPGQMNCVTSGLAAVSHMVAEVFKVRTGTDFRILHFQGGSPALIDLMGGHSHFGFLSVSNAKSNAEAGKLRILAVMGSSRSNLMPEVPTFAEAGGPGMEVDGWFGLAAPAGTPQPIIDRLSRELREVLAVEELKTRFLKTGAEIQYSSPQAFGDRLVREIALWTDVVKAAGLKLER